MEQKEQNLAAEQELTQAELSELLQIRRDKLKALQEAGQDPLSRFGTTRAAIAGTWWKTTTPWKAGKYPWQAG